MNKKYSPLIMNILHSAPQIQKKINSIQAECHEFLPKLSSNDKRSFEHYNAQVFNKQVNLEIQSSNAQSIKELQEQTITNISQTQKMPTIFPNIQIIQNLMISKNQLVSFRSVQPNTLDNYSVTYLFQVYEKLNIQTYIPQLQGASTWTLTLAEQIFRAGNYFLQLKKYPPALQLYQLAIDLCPSLPQPVNNLAYIYYLQNQSTKAKVLIKEITQKNPRNQILISNLGITLKNQNYEQAIKEFTLAKSLEPNISNINNLANIYLEIGSTKQAIALYQEALSIKPNDYSYNGLAIAHTMLFKFQEALKYYKLCSEQEQLKQAILINKAHTLYQANYIDQAWQCFQEGIDLYPHSAAKFYSGLGQIFFTLGDLNKSHLNFKKSLESQPQLACCYSNFIIFLIKTGRISQGLGILSSLLTRDDLEGQINIIQIISLLEHKIPLINIINLLSQWIPKQKKLLHQAINNKACLLASISKQYEESALEEIVKALKIRPEPNIIYNAGCLLYYLQQKQNALTCFLKCVELDQQFSQPYYSIGIILLQAKKYQEAFTFFKKHLALKPNHYQTENAIGIIHYLMKNYDKAEQQFNLSLAINQQYQYALSNKALILSLSNKPFKISHYFRSVNIWTLPQIIFNKANILFKRNQLEMARLQFTRAADVKLNFLEAHHNLSVLLFKIKKTKEAVKQIKRAILIDPTSSLCYITLALYSQNNKIKSYKSKVADLISTRYSNNYKVHLNLALLNKLTKEDEQKYKQQLEIAFLNLIDVDEGVSSEKINQGIQFIEEIRNQLNDIKNNDICPEFTLFLAFLLKKINKLPEYQNNLKKYLTKNGEAQYLSDLAFSVITTEIEKFSTKMKQILSKFIFQSILELEGQRITILFSQLNNNNNFKFLLNHSPHFLIDSDQKSSERLVLQRAAMFSSNSFKQLSIFSQSAINNSNASLQKTSTEMNENETKGIKNFNYEQQFLKIMATNEYSQIKRWQSLQIDPPNSSKQNKFAKNQDKINFPIKTEPVKRQTSNLLEKYPPQQQIIQIENFSPQEVITITLKEQKQDYELSLLHKLIFFQKILMIEDLKRVKSTHFTQHRNINSQKMPHQIYDNLKYNQYCYSVDKNDDFTLSTLESCNKYEIYQFIKEISLIFKELQQRQIHHPQLNFSCLSRSGTHLICKNFSQAFPVALKEENKKSYHSIQTILSFWLTIENHPDYEHLINSTIFKGLYQMVMYRVFRMRSSFFLRQQPADQHSFDEILKQMINFARKAMKIDHWKQFKELISNILNRCSISTKILTQQETQSILELVERQKGQESFQYFEKELELISSPIQENCQSKRTVDHTKDYSRRKFKEYLK